MMKKKSSFVIYVLKGFFSGMIMWVRLPIHLWGYFVFLMKKEFNKENLDNLTLNYVPRLKHSKIK